MSIVPLHNLPSRWLPGHTPQPKIFPCVGYLASDFEVCPKIIKPIGIELKVLAGDFQGVNGLEWRWRGELVKQDSGRGLTNIKGIGVVRYYDIRLIE